MRQALPSVMRIVGEEIACLGQDAASLQDLLGDLVADDDIQGIMAVQAIDGITQALESIARFLTALAPALPAECLPDLAHAVSTIPLANLARRLTLTPVPVPQDHELELWG